VSCTPLLSSPLLSPLLSSPFSSPLLSSLLSSLSHSPPAPLIASRYSKRSSSARWDIDELSLVEKRTYKSQMGFAGLTPGKKTA
jgi:hypothetical protein